MKTLKEILGTKKHIWIEVAEYEKMDFLAWAKENGCRWINGDNIDVFQNNCGCHMGINEKLRMGFVSLYCWTNHFVNSPIKIKFSEVLNG